jgi:hypothetical protein
MLLLLSRGYSRARQFQYESRPDMACRCASSTSPAVAVEMATDDVTAVIAAISVRIRLSLFADPN